MAQRVTKIYVDVIRQLNAVSPMQSATDMVTCSEAAGNLIRAEDVVTCGELISHNIKNAEDVVVAFSAPSVDFVQSAEDTIVCSEAATLGIRAEDSVTCSELATLIISARDTITCSEVNSVMLMVSRTGTDTVTCSEANSVMLNISKSVSDTVTCGENAVATFIQPYRAEDVVTIDTAIAHNFLSAEDVVVAFSAPRDCSSIGAQDAITCSEVAAVITCADDIVICDDDANYFSDAVRSAADTVTCSEQATPDILIVSAEDTVTCNDVAHIQQDYLRSALDVVDCSEAANKVGGIFVYCRTGSDLVTINQPARAALHLATAAQRSAQDTITCSENARNLDLHSAQDTVTCSETANGKESRSAGDQVACSEEATVQLVVSCRSATNTVTVEEYAGATKLELCISNIPTPAIGPKEFQLNFPAVGPTLTVDLRNPLFGDKHRLHHNRLQGPTRGGDMFNFRDPVWPKGDHIMVTFRALKPDKRDELKAFLDASLGQKVSVRDHHGRTRDVIIMNPSEPFITDNINNISVKLELEVLL